MQRKKFPGRDYDKERGRCCNPSRDRNGSWNKLSVKIFFSQSYKVTICQIFTNWMWILLVYQDRQAM